MCMSLSKIFSFGLCVKTNDKKKKKMYKENIADTDRMIQAHTVVLRSIKTKKENKRK